MNNETKPSVDDLKHEIKALRAELNRRDNAMASALAHMRRGRDSDIDAAFRDLEEFNND